MLIARLLLVLEVWDGKPTYRKSLAGILFGVVRFDLRPLLQGQTKIAKLKSGYNSLIIGPRGLGYEIMGWKSFGVVGFHFGPLLQGQMRIAKLKSAYRNL